MKSLRVAVVTFCLAGAGVFAAGCTLIGETPSARFYVLAPEGPTDGQEAAVAPLAVGIGPIVLPEYVERPQIVTRSGPNRLELYEYDRWAEPLDYAVPSVLAEDVARMLGTERVVTHPWRASVDVDYQVTARIVRFDGEVGGPAILVARWRIYDGPGRNILTMRRSRFEAEAGAGTGPQGVVEALNATVTAFAQEISEGVAALAKSGD